MPQLKSPAYYLDAAEKILMSGGYSKEKEALFRSTLKLSEAAASLDGSQNKRGQNIEYRSSEERSDWIDYLRTGRYQRRDMSSGGTGLGGSSALVPLGFYNFVTHALKQFDELLDPEIVSVVKTERGSPFALPTDYDTTAAATVVNENQQNAAATDPTLGMVALPVSPTWRTSIFASLEFLQDSGIPLDTFLALIFAVRYARGFGASLVSTLLAGAFPTVGAAGATASQQAGPSLVLGSDDLIKLAQSLDRAYLSRACWAMQPNSYLALLGLRGTGSGNLVFSHESDAEGHPLLLGRRVLFCPSMPLLGSGGKSVVLGDFSRLIVRMSSSMTLQASAERRPETGSIYFWSTWRLQGAVAVDPNLAAGSDKPFVTFSSGALTAAEERAQPAKQESDTVSDLPKGGHHHGGRTARA